MNKKWEHHSHSTYAASILRKSKKWSLKYISKNGIITHTYVVWECADRTWILKFMQRFSSHEKSVVVTKTNIICMFDGKPLPMDNVYLMITICSRLVENVIIVAVYMDIKMIKILCNYNGINACTIMIKVHVHYAPMVHRVKSVIII